MSQPLWEYSRMEKKIQKPTLKSTLKSLDTEETIDLLFYRPIGYGWALLCQKLGIVPNAVTIVSIFIGIAGGVLLGYADLTYNVIGMVLIVLANSLDSADGQLARMTGNFSRIGRILDGFCGDLWFITIYTSLCVKMMHQGWGASVFILAAVAGFFHARQASMADYYRNFHLYMIKGKAGSELDEASKLKEVDQSLPWKHNFWKKAMLFFYIRYTQGQERVSPSMQALRRQMKQRYGDDIPDWLRTQFRQQSKPLMKYTNILSFNTRIIVLFISVLVDLPWLYFAFELTVLNILLLYMIYRHEHICAYFVNELNADKSCDCQE